MTKNLLALSLLLSCVAGSQTVVSTGNHRKVFTVACSPPSTVSRWAAENTSNRCTGSVACTDGAQGILQVDSNATNNASNGSSAGPVYKTNQINGLPAWQFGILTNNLWFDLASGIPQTGSITLYAVIKTYSIVPPSNAFAIYGVSSGHGMEWGLFNSSSTNKQYANSQGATALGTSTGTYAVSTNYTLAMTYTYSSGALAFFNCSAGTCNADGTATHTASFPNPTNVLGAARDVNDYFKGYITEWGWTNSATTAGIAAWSQCHYGI